MIRCSSSLRVCPDALAFELSLILHTGEGKLIVMAPTFDVLHEAVLHTEEFGEGKKGSP